MRRRRRPTRGLSRQEKETENKIKCYGQNGVFFSGEYNFIIIVWLGFSCLYLVNKNNNLIATYSKNVSSKK